MGVGQGFSSSVVPTVKYKATVVEGVSEEFAQVVIVSFLKKVQVLHVVQQSPLGVLRVPHGHSLLCVPHLLLVFLECVYLEPLLGWAATQEVHEHLYIITAALLLAQVCVDAHVASCASQAFVLVVQDVLLGLCVNAVLDQAKVNDVDGMLLLAAQPSHQEVLKLHIVVDEDIGVIL